jgi:signal transduction histidine kinase
MDDRHEYMVVEAATAEEGARLLTEEFYDCVVMEYSLPGVDGLTVLKSVRDSAGGTLDSPVVMITGHGSEAIAVEAMKLGVSDYLPKSVMTAEAFERAVSRAIERSRLRMALREQNHHLQHVNAELHRKAAELERFYHTVSHELKTPLTAVREFIALLRDGIGGPPLSEQQQDFVAHSLEGCDHIARQVNDLLDSARSDTEKLQLQPEWLDVRRTIDFAAASVQQSVLAKQLALEVQVAPELPRVIADHGKLAQVIGNLLNNAVKFTQRGGTVRVCARPRPGASDQVEIAVSDTGCGIAPEHVDRVFERLYQVPVSGEAATGSGLGLGLSIARDLVHRHGGELTVQSAVGVGSTFRFNLPAAPRVPGADTPGAGAAEPRTRP